MSEKCPNLQKAADPKPTDKPIESSIPRYLAIGGLAIVVMFGGVGTWAAVASISGAVIAPASVVVESHRKDVQHLQGGIVGKILVSNGDAVNAGDVLLRLNETMPKSNLGVVVAQLDELLTQRARLKAEIAGNSEFDLPQELVGRQSDPTVREVLDGQRTLLEAQIESLNGQRLQLKERIGQLHQEIIGLDAQRLAKEAEIALINDELAGLESLSKKGLVPKTKLMSLKRQAAQLNGDRGRFIAEIARAKGRISETEVQIIQLEKDRRTEAVTELREAQAKIAELIEKKTAAEDQLRRIEIRAPIGGYVHQMAFHTVGGVIQAGQTIMQIVPMKDVLLVEARLDPADIDQVQVNQKVVIRFPGFDQRTTPELHGVVKHISADITRDQQLQQEYYTVRVALADKEVARLGGRELMPGMPAESFFQTGQRSALSYLVKPLADQIERAFREQ